MTANLALSPWSKAAMDPAEIAALDERAGDLDCVVSTIKRRDRRWMARAIANRGWHVEPFIGATLPGAIAGALHARGAGGDPGTELLAGGSRGG